MEGGELLENLELIDLVEHASPSDAKPADEVRFNTGNYEVSVVSQEDFFDNELGDAYFEDDGSYTIQIPEENPFFPYEVQFTYKGKVSEKWFMTPDDSLEIGDHTFYVSAYFDDTVVTQMSLEVAGDEVIVYPERKTFTDGDGVMPMSLLPLEEKYLRLDLTGYTPVELTQVSIASLFAGENEFTADDKVMWCFEDENDYQISAPGDEIDLSRDTSYGNNTWQMIVGDDDQLAADNIRYIVELQTTESERWLVPTFYAQDSEGKRTPVKLWRDSWYSDYDYDRQSDTYVDGETIGDSDLYVGLSLNTDVFPDPMYDEMKAFEGLFYTVDEAEAGNEITEQLFERALGQTDTGYLVKHNAYDITLVTYQNGVATGCLPFTLWVSRQQTV